MSRYILTEQQINSLKRYIAVQMRNHSTCDGTLRYTKKWLEKNIPAEQHDAVLEELENGGGFCDCEVIMNCYQD
jgi:hypothetical protein